MGLQWYQKQLRILQTVLREKDLEAYDAAGVVAYMKKTDANCIVVNAGGVLDFFPGRAEMGRANRFIGEQDILRELTELCHQNQIHVIARVDFRGVEKERYERHPDWFGQNRDGSPLMGWNDQLYRPCYSSFYGNEHAEQFLKELFRTYDIDGVWENCVIFGYGPCYCKKCREAYRRSSQKEIPDTEDYFSEEFREYREWKSLLARKHMEKMRSTVKLFGEDKVYVSEIFDMYHVKTALNSGIDLYDARDCFDFLVSPLFPDGGSDPNRKYENPSYAAAAVHFMKSISKGKQCVALTGNNGTKWRYVRAPGLESRLWMWEVISAGGLLWNNYFNGQHPDVAVDRRNAELQADMFRYLKQNEAYLQDMKPEGEAGIYYSRPTRDWYGSREKDDYTGAVRGVERVLTEHHIQYRFIPDIELTMENLKGLRVLILPNVVCLSESQQDVIRSYVKNGGGLVASYRTSLCDENGNAREDFGLKDLFGCSFTGIEKDTQFDSYQKIRMEEHPILWGLDANRTDMLLNEAYTLLCKKENQQYNTICTYIPPIYNQPPEYAWIQEEETDYPTVITGTQEHGRVVYFANQIDKACHTHGHEDLTQLFYRAVCFAAGDCFRFCTDAPESVHLYVTADGKGARIISMVNTSMGSFRPAREIIPVRDFQVRICGCRMKGVRILYGDRKCQVFQDENDVVITVPEIIEFTSVYLENN